MAIKTFEQQKIISIVNDETLSEQEKVDQFGESFVKLTQLTVDVVAGCVESIETPEGTVTDSDMIKEFIENSSSETFNAINERVSKMRDEISLKSETVECQHCQFKFEIDITMDQANFFAVGS
jgi:cell division GTPase FtsZ